MTGNHLTGPDHARKLITQKYPSGRATIRPARVLNRGLHKGLSKSSSKRPISCVEKNWIAPDSEGGTALPMSEGTWMSPERKKAISIFR